MFSGRGGHQKVLGCRLPMREAHGASSKAKDNILAQDAETGFCPCSPQEVCPPLRVSNALGYARVVDAGFS
jgi:hypothetical protein